MEGTLATIMIFAGNFAPTNWLFCDGSLQSISNYDALFSLIGTTYGGDGQQTFALPDLRSRVPVGAGTGAGLSTISLGEMAGTESVTMLQPNLPMHVHQMSAKVSTTSANADGSNNPAKVLATTAQSIYAPLPGTPVLTNLGGVSVSLGFTGGSQPIPIMQSYQAINYVICVEGIYPTRS